MIACRSNAILKWSNSVGVGQLLGGVCMGPSQIVVDFNGTLIAVCTTSGYIMKWNGGSGKRMINVFAL
jgi:hypothetical protein